MKGKNMKTTVKSTSVILTLTEGMLGTKAGNQELLADYIASKHPEGIQSDEMDTAPDPETAIEKGTTVFNRNDDGTPFIFDYQIKGFFKDAQKSLNRIPEMKMTAYKQIIDGLIFVTPRRIKLAIPEGKDIGICERPLRVSTPQGERFSIARSEEVPAGTVLSFSVMCLDAELLGRLSVWLDYGSLRGLGQWRNSGKGRFEWQEGIIA